MIKKEKKNREKNNIIVLYVIKVYQSNSLFKI